MRSVEVGWLITATKITTYTRQSADSTARLSRQKHKSHEHD